MNDMNKYSKSMVKYPTKQSNNNLKQKTNNRQQQQKVAHWKSIPSELAEHAHGTQLSADLLRKEETVPLNGPLPSAQHIRCHLADRPSGLHYTVRVFRKANPNPRFPEPKQTWTNPISRIHNQTKDTHISSHLESKNKEIHNIIDHTTQDKDQDEIQEIDSTK